MPRWGECPRAHHERIQPFDPGVADGAAFLEKLVAEDRDAWADGRLLVVELDPPPSDVPGGFSAGGPVPLDLARAVVEATLATFGERQ